MLIADRTNDTVGAETALRQIETAYEAARSGGGEHLSEHLQVQLTGARAIRDRLKKHSGICSIAASGTATGNTVNCGPTPADPGMTP